MAERRLRPRPRAADLPPSMQAFIGPEQLREAITSLRLEFAANLQALNRVDEIEAKMQKLEEKLVTQVMQLESRYNIHVRHHDEPGAGASLRGTVR